MAQPFIGQEHTAVFRDGDVLPRPEITVSKGQTQEDLQALIALLTEERDALKLKNAELIVALNNAYAEQDSHLARVRTLERQLEEATADN